jgi:transcriptional regulator with XRE-family HTH domain
MKRSSKNDCVVSDCRVNKNIKRLRIKNRMTHKELASLSKRTRIAIVKIEGCTRGGTSIYFLERLSKIFGCSLDEFLK